MRLPGAVYADRITKGKQIKFRGLNHRVGAGDGEIWDMLNLTGDHYPVLAVREKRRKYRTLAEPGGLSGWDGLCWVDDTDFLYKGEVKGQVTAGRKRFGCMGPNIVILPDKCYYNVETDTFGSMEASWTGDKLTFTNGLLYDEVASANAIYAEGVNWSDWFREGDAVTITGCTKHPENNKTPIIREIKEDILYFYEDVFTLENGEEYTETGELSLKRTVPDLKFICQNENRLWGCDDTTIYASKWNDILNWNVYDGLDSDSWALTPGTPGHFTGCISYKGYAIFFKEDWICKVYGSVPSEFAALGTASLGLAEGSDRSLAVAGEVMFYLSRNGIMAYTGGIPQSIGEAFGTERFRNAVAGSDGLKYYVSMEGEGGSTWLYAYDTRTGMWHKEDRTKAEDFAVWDGNLYCLNDAGEIWILGDPVDPPKECTVEETVPWMAEFADFTEENPNKKGVGKAQIRLELEEGAVAQVWIQFDSDGVWHPMGREMAAGVKRSYYLPVIPRRCDHYRLKVTGTGGCRIHSLTREYYIGSEMKSTKGRN